VTTHPTHPSHPSRPTHLFVLFALLVFVSACGGASEAPAAGGGGAPAAAPAPPTAFSQTDLQLGTGTQAGQGAHITVKYTGWVYDASKPENKGMKFDSTDDHDPISFTLGNREVIPGWDQGFTGMRIGGKRRLIIPPSLGYGAEGNPPIPPNAGLVFDMELIEVK
jgi:FKBP-type peptidyl-prolyl cis-trans isomerase FkpA